MDELKWPVDKCENPKCGFDLREVTCKAKDKTGLSSDGLKTPMYTAYCPQCGKGYQVGFVEIPEKKVMTQEKVLATVPSPNQVPEEPEPEPYIEPKGKAQTIHPGKVEKPRSPNPGEFLCFKCSSIHRETSKVGKKHLKYKAEV